MARIVNATTVTVLTIYGRSVGTVLRLTYLDPFPAVAVPYSVVHEVQTAWRTPDIPPNGATFGFFPGVKRPGRETEQSVISIVQVKGVSIHTSNLC